MTIEEELRAWTIALRWAFMGMVFAGLTLLFELIFIIQLFTDGGLQTVGFLTAGSFILAHYCMWCSRDARPPKK